jgi:hypothetical protein
MDRTSTTPAAQALDLGETFGARTGKRRGGRGARLARAGVGGLFLIGAGVHVGLVSADAAVYRHFADGSPLGWVIL